MLIFKVSRHIGCIREEGVLEGALFPQHFHLLASKEATEVGLDADDHPDLLLGVSNALECGLRVIQLSVGVDRVVAAARAHKI